MGKESWLQSDEEGAPSYSADSGRLTNLLVGSMQVIASYRWQEQVHDFTNQKAARNITPQGTIAFDTP